MNSLHVKLEHCYGIRWLEHDFDFRQTQAIAVYAPNGVMKSSFARTFEDVANGVDSADMVYPNRPTTRVITKDGTTEIAREEVLVVRPYDESFGGSDEVSTLLVDAKLRKEYEDLHRDVEEAKQALVKALKEVSGSKRDFEFEISQAFTSRSGQFYQALLRVRDEVRQQRDAPFADVPYDIVFDDKVLALLETQDIKNLLSEYVTKYNDLLEQSTYFRKGYFTYYHASNIAKALDDNGFFEAKHSITLNSKEALEISSRDELERLISEEKAQITNDPKLRKKYEEIEKLIMKNVSVRAFQSYVSATPEVLPHLENLAAFRQDVLKSFLKSRESLFDDVVTRYEAAAKRKQEIEQEALLQRTDWEEVIDIFNDRFVVPFTLVAKNKASVMLGQELLSVGFLFDDGGGEEVELEKDELVAVLSTGEKKALYILNVLYEVEVRKKRGAKTLMIVDDIADSFDYRNKYAIIQYLQEIAQGGAFKQILLTHNFDFFRSVSSRFVGYPHCLMVSKTTDGLSIKRASGINNVFVKDWKQHYATNMRKALASVPFMRNLIEYTKGEDDPDYVLLTKLLHIKPGTEEVRIKELDLVYARLFGAFTRASGSDWKVVDKFFAEAEECAATGAESELESKVILSIATRLRAEKYMIAKIGDESVVAALQKNQTFRLLQEHERRFPYDTACIAVIRRVLLMTPENIHLNSFMYEPIIDMSGEHLKRLYQDVCALTA